MSSIKPISKLLGLPASFTENQLWKENTIIIKNDKAKPTGCENSTAAIGLLEAWRKKKPRCRLTVWFATFLLFREPHPREAAGVKRSIDLKIYTLIIFHIYPTKLTASASMSGNGNAHRGCQTIMIVEIFGHNSRSTSQCRQHKSFPAAIAITILCQPIMVYQAPTTTAAWLGRWLVTPTSYRGEKYFVRQMASA